MFSTLKRTVPRRRMAANTMNRHVRNFLPGDGTASWAFPELDTLGYARTPRVRHRNILPKDPHLDRTRIEASLRVGERRTSDAQITKLHARDFGSGARLPKSPEFHESRFISRAMQPSLSLSLSLSLSRGNSALEK